MTTVWIFSEPGIRLHPARVQPPPVSHLSRDASTVIKIILADVHTTCDVGALLVDARQYLAVLVIQGNSSLQNKLGHLSSFRSNQMNWHIHDLLSCAQLQALLRHDPHDFNNLFPDLLDVSIDNLLNDTIGHSILRNELYPSSRFLLNRWNWRGNDLLHCVALHTLLWEALHNFNNSLHHLQNGDVNGLFNDALLSSFLRHRRNHLLIEGHERRLARLVRVPKDLILEHGYIQCQVQVNEMCNDQILFGDLCGFGTRFTGVLSDLALGIAGGKFCKV